MNGLQLDYEKIKVFKVSNMLVINSVEEDALLSDIKSLSYLF